MLKKINETADFLKQAAGFEPEVGIILGTGLGKLTAEIDVVKSFPYGEIPNFPVSTVEGHSGNLIFGLLAGKKVVAMQGRFHFYEGYSMQELVFPVRVMKMLGIHTLVLSNACGGVNPDFEVGDLMIINDHINLFPTNPLIGQNIDELGPRFPDMSSVYSPQLIETATEIAAANNIPIRHGIYAGLTGPCLETPAEYHYIRVIGADTVGMSTVPEVIAATHMGLACFAMSVITDLGVKGKIVETTHEDVQRVASEAEPKLTTIVKGLLATL